MKDKYTKWLKGGKNIVKILLYIVLFYYLYKFFGFMGFVYYIGFICLLAGWVLYKRRKQYIEGISFLAELLYEIFFAKRRLKKKQEGKK